MPPLNPCQFPGTVSPMDRTPTCIPAVFAFFVTLLAAKASVDPAVEPAGSFTCKLAPALGRDENAP